jgi:Response regulator containing a CheY-like receiver domain and an HTH DNA-binding domain
MRTDTIETLFLEELQDIRHVEKQILQALIRIAKGVSGQGLWQALMPLLETTEHRVRRLEIAAARARRPRVTPQAELTLRERTVLQLIAEGYANKQIAAELSISIKTVEKHRQHMMAKLDLHDTAGVTRYAISAGVVEASA